MREASYAEPALSLVQLHAAKGEKPLQNSQRRGAGAGHPKRQHQNKPRSHKIASQDTLKVEGTVQAPTPPPATANEGGGGSPQTPEERLQRLIEAYNSTDGVVSNLTEVLNTVKAGVVGVASIAGNGTESLVSALNSVKGAIGKMTIVLGAEKVQQVQDFIDRIIGNLNEDLWAPLEKLLASINSRCDQITADVSRSNKEVRLRLAIAASARDVQCHLRPFLDYENASALDIVPAVVPDQGEDAETGCWDPPCLFQKMFGTHMDENTRIRKDTVKKFLKANSTFMDYLDLVLKKNETIYAIVAQVEDTIRGKMDKLNATIQNTISNSGVALPSQAMSQINKAIANVFSLLDQVTSSLDTLKAEIEQGMSTTFKSLDPAIFYYSVIFQKAVGCQDRFDAVAPGVDAEAGTVLVFCSTSVGKPTVVGTAGCDGTNTSCWHTDPIQGPSCSRGWITLGAGAATAVNLTGQTGVRFVESSENLVPWAVTNASMVITSAILPSTLPKSGLYVLMLVDEPSQGFPGPSMLLYDGCDGAQEMMRLKFGSPTAGGLGKACSPH